MSVKVKVFGDANDVMDKVRELRAAKLVQGRDFDFSFYQSTWDDMIGEIPKNAIFTFYTDKYATFYALKWA
jgi:hypothetical protein